jgi:hypothetical protein
MLGYRGLVKVLVLGAGVFALRAAIAQEMPRLVQEQGRATLMVDGKPFWMLGAQVDNSNGWPERLKEVWPAAVGSTDGEIVLVSATGTKARLKIRLALKPYETSVLVLR